MVPINFQRVDVTDKELGKLFWAVNLANWQWNEY